MADMRPHIQELFENYEGTGAIEFAPAQGRLMTSQGAAFRFTTLGDAEGRKHSCFFAGA
jgi:hypothetical protein